MGLRTQQAYAQWIGVDPRSGASGARRRSPCRGRQGRRLAALLDHNPRIASLWLRLAQEQELVALAAAATGGPPARADRLATGRVRARRPVSSALPSPSSH